jgi:hypothetical protein
MIKSMDTSSIIDAQIDCLSSPAASSSAGLTIVALFGLYWSRQERKDPDRYRRRR